MSDVTVMIIYWCGYPIAFAGVLWLLWLQAIESKRELTKAESKAASSDLNSTYNAMVHAQDEYGWARVFLFIGPPIIAFFWPLGVVLGVGVAFVWAIGWLLDKAVSATMKEPDQ